MHSQSRILLVPRLAALALLMSFSACGGENDDSDDLELSTFERIQTQVFDVSCSSDSCHSSVGQTGELVLENGHSYDSLMNQPAANPVASDHGWMRVMPGDPSSSFLMAKLTSTLAAGEGSSMPWGAAPLDAKTVEVISAWIAAGAPKTGRVAGDDGSPLNGGGDDPGEIHLPPPARGIQLDVTAHPVPKGTEETLCHFMKLPSDVDLDVNRIQIAVSGGSHHIHLYRAIDKDMNVPDGVEVCNMAVDFEKWSLVIASQLRRTDWELPAGVAFHLRAGEQVLVQTHFVNVGSLETEGEGRVLMNLNDADPGAVQQYAGALFGQDKDVFVPALSNPTQSATCEFPNPITMMAQTGHYHFRGRRFSTFLWNQGVRGEEIYHHEGYDDPKFEVYPLDASPTFAPGEGLEWECYWENRQNMDFKFGPFTDTNEHCNLFVFYYPTQTPNESMTCVKQGGVNVTTVRTGD